MHGGRWDVEDFGRVRRPRLPRPDQGRDPLLGEVPREAGNGDSRPDGAQAVERDPAGGLGFFPRHSSTGPAQVTALLDEQPHPEVEPTLRELRIPLLRLKRSGTVGRS
ncbi:hypothetical protein GCM10010398_15750 [Streptomyces fimbriatus]